MERQNIQAKNVQTNLEQRTEGNFLSRLGNTAKKYATIAVVGAGLAMGATSCSPYFMGVRDGNSVCLEKYCSGGTKTVEECSGSFRDRECKNVTSCLGYSTRTVPDHYCDQK